MQIDIPNDILRTDIGIAGDSTLRERVGFPSLSYSKAEIDLAHLGWPADPELPDPEIPGISVEKVSFARKIWFIGPDEGAPIVPIKTDEWIAIMTFLMKKGQQTADRYARIHKVGMLIAGTYTGY